jgi:hypothetical protein
VQAAPDEDCTVTGPASIIHTVRGAAALGRDVASAWHPWRAVCQEFAAAPPTWIAKMCMDLTPGSRRADGITDGRQDHGLHGLAGIDGGCRDEKADRVHQLVADADLDALDAALGELRAAGWPAPEHPDCGQDTGLDGRDLIADRPDDEVSWLRQAAGWLTQLHAGGYPQAVNLRPGDDWPDTAHVAAGLARVAAVLDCIASGAGELGPGPAGPENSRSRPSGRRAERRRRLAGPDLEFGTFCRTKQMPSSTRAQMERAWDAWQAGRYRHGETGQQPACTGNPFRGR